MANKPPIINEEESNVEDALKLLPESEPKVLEDVERAEKIVFD